MHVLTSQQTIVASPWEVRKGIFNNIQQYGNLDHLKNERGTF